MFTYKFYFKTPTSDTTTFMYQSVMTYHEFKNYLNESKKYYAGATMYDLDLSTKVIVFIEKEYNYV